MDSYQLQAEREMWDAIATQDAPPRAAGHAYRAMPARYRGKCDHCGATIRPGTPIRYSTYAPRGHKVLCVPCWGS